MEDRVKKRRKPDSQLLSRLVVGLVCAVLLVSGGISIGVSLARGPDPLEVQTSLRSYVESMAIAGKIVLVEARDRVSIRQTTPGLLFGDTSFGRFLGIRSDATVEASAWADVAYVIDLYATEAWSIRYDAADGGSLAVAAPPLGMLTPAIHTDTIEITTTDRSIFLDERQLESSALAGLTARFVEAASAMLDEPELRSKATAALEAVVRTFAETNGIPLERVDVAFAPAED
ncbi:MAG: hypothetical protein JXM71_10510 [Spirochaetales bacterium]|nr:hypothetical protein [Spirochaetales bacterium]